MAEDLKPVFRIIEPTKPSVQSIPAANYFTVCCPIIINVVHRKKLRLRLTAANTYTSVSPEDLCTKINALNAQTSHAFSACFKDFARRGGERR